MVTATIEGDLRSAGGESDKEPFRPFQVQSYKHLLHCPEIPVGTKSTPSGKRDITCPVVDAIIVPTIRSADQIASAVELAARARCQLVTLYTDFPAGLAPVLAKVRRDATPLALRSRLKHHMLALGANLPQSLVPPGALDISTKRNLGLLIGRACGWTRMLFLDDDIRKLSIEKLSAAAALLDKFPVVGLQVNKYPDASVVGHARRLTGRRQEPFISGGSLLVNPQELNGFFPPVYHEDWLCIINHLRRGEVAIGGTVGQLPYKPFTSPERARFEEFGDILASGLLWLVHSRRKASAKSASRDDCSAISDHEYWRDVMRTRFWEDILDQRAALLDNIATRLKRLNPADLLPLRSLEAAQERCKELRSGEFAVFTEKWVTSLAVWRDWEPYRPQADSVEKALAELGLSDVARLHEPQAERESRWTGEFAGHWGRRAAAGGRGRFRFRGL